jgi:probable FeS assembly SUF system protein SufT
MEAREPIILNRDCEVTQIPSGYKMKLPRGTKVRIAQSLGGTYTVITEQGYMVRIEAKDADAIGMEVAKEVFAPAESSGSAAPTAESVEKAVWDQLRTCYDPEIPVNIVELGLIYDCKVTPLMEGEYKAGIKMTLTAPGCGMGTALAADAQSKLLRIPGVKEAQVELVWMPPWTPDKMSEAAKLQLGMM